MDQLLSILGQEKEIFWYDHRDCSQPEIEQLWALRKAEIVATLDPDTPSMPPNSSVAAGAGSQQAPVEASTMIRAASDRPRRSQNCPMSSKQPTASGVSMARNNTMGAIAPSGQANPPRQTATMLKRGQPGAPSLHQQPTYSEEPWNLLQPPNKLRRVNHTQNAMPVRSFSPADFVERNSGEQSNALSSFTTQVPLRRARNDYLFTVPRPSPAGISPLSLSPIGSPQTPLTDGSTASTDMSRVSSIGSQVHWEFDNIRIASSPSGLANLDSRNAASSFQLTSDCDSLSTPETKSSTASNPQADYYLHLVQGLPSSSAPRPAEISFDENIGLTMDGDFQNGPSVLDNMDDSAASRRRRLSDQMARADRPLRPKSEESSQTDGSDKTLTGLPQTETPAQENGQKKIAIVKLPDNKPEVARHKCPRCNKHPEGFRGPHELVRHYERDHSVERTMWVCIDSSPGGKMLGSCKHCRAGKKYGAYYNAAAHIRRHFKRAAGGRSGAGSSGGTWPPMEELKAKWIQQVKITVPADDDDVTAQAPSPDAEPDSPTSPVVPSAGTDAQPTVGTAAFSEPLSFDLPADLSFDDFVFDLGDLQ